MKLIAKGRSSRLGESSFLSNEEQTLWTKGLERLRFDRASTMQLVSSLLDSSNLSNSSSKYWNAENPLKHQTNLVRTIVDKRRKHWDQIMLHWGREDVKEFKDFLYDNLTVVENINPFHLIENQSRERLLCMYWELLKQHIKDSSLERLNTEKNPHHCIFEGKQGARFKSNQKVRSTHLETDCKGTKRDLVSDSCIRHCSRPSRKGWTAPESKTNSWWSLSRKTPGFSRKKASPSHAGNVNVLSWAARTRISRSWGAQLHMQRVK